jgi:hypothetical protein
MCCAQFGAAPRNSTSAGKSIELHATWKSAAGVNSCIPVGGITCRTGSLGLLSYIVSFTHHKILNASVYYCDNTLHFTTIRMDGLIFIIKAIVNNRSCLLRESRSSKMLVC